jgi:hypothetical protein
VLFAGTELPNWFAVQLATAVPAFKQLLPNIGTLDPLLLWMNQSASA